jgi:hypothetical protein
LGVAAIIKKYTTLFEKAWHSVQKIFIINTRKFPLSTQANAKQCKVRRTFIHSQGISCSLDKCY